jgi:hypothetical protein
MGHLQNFKLTEVVHRAGINIRDLGLIRQLCAKTFAASTLILIEMTARWFKVCRNIKKNFFIKFRDI